MRWPSVRRVTYEAALARIIELEARTVTLALTVDRLTTERDDAQTGAMLAHEALAKMTTQQDAAQSVARERSELTRAIRDQSRGADGRIDPRLVGYFRSRANDLLNQKLPVKDVIATLSEWQTTENSTLGISPERMVEAAEGER